MHGIQAYHKKDRICFILEFFTLKLCFLKNSELVESQDFLDVARNQNSLQFSGLQFCKTGLEIFNHRSPRLSTSIFTDPLRTFTEIIMKHFHDNYYTNILFI